MRILSIILLITILGCKPQPHNDNNMSNTTTHKYTNALINETSPYLLQHAHNPVNWMPWGEEALQKAKNEDKPIIISIGYSSCHWCHVMEHESFEDEEVAAVMNEKFICIKVDREERPDIDQVYMDALNSMGLGGGWPLNAVTTPDGKPFYGGTYFPKDRWIAVLNHLSKTYQDKKDKIQESADENAMRLNFSELKRYGLSDSAVQYNDEGLNEIYKLLSAKFDKNKGGMEGTPKFPMPSLWRFMLRYYQHSNIPDALNQIKITLDKMALGGLYDQVGGGFTRYSTDADWFAPHFEKMLYDNGQLISLYSEAYRVTQSPLYKHTVYQSLGFIKREMTSQEGGFYSALDADSEGEEGKFYTWKKEELDSLIGDDIDLFSEIYSIRPKGNWESTNILHRNEDNEMLAQKHGMTMSEIESKIEHWNNTLLKVRSTRVRPGLDDKILLGWNAIMLNGYIDAYRTFNEPEFLEAALVNANFIEKKLKKGKSYFHTYKSGLAKIDAYMDDLAHLCSAYINLYQATFDEAWLWKAKSIADYSIEHYFDREEKMFFYTSNTAEKLIVRKKELFDDVIPGSNSVMAKNLYELSLYFYDDTYSEISTTMSGITASMLFKEPYFLSQWAIYYTLQTSPTAEIAIIGDNIEEYRKEFDEQYIPNAVIAATKTSSTIPLLNGRTRLENNTTIYVCFNKTCKLPVTSVEKALSLIHKK